MNYDITFCSNTKCKNLECKRNQNNYEIGNRLISIGKFIECEHWKEVSND